MPIIRNPFRRQDEAARPTDEKTARPQHIDINTKQPTEYKLSEIDDSGAYLPPSPTERGKTFWSSRSNGSTTSSNQRSILSPDEPFNISRESFDSYRRSFDICARSPVIPPEARPRVSLDSRVPYQPRHSSSFNRPEPTREEDFEDVGLNDDQSKPKKRGFFSRFGDSNNEQQGEGRPGSSNGGHHFHIGGRRRGHSGTGQELGDMNRDSAN
ncbi:hypothetical protein K461DRAFT_280023 [Myriangium duriaei CBS 260.36]|uniref:Uncharacterized protein n=1 Tax=Myriangium duriaei CBS 260.36 TaxID=1168546 RepID=A0A9P4IX29_9PEZI|nr:hypothetical protein K461DRAFT_280023 [Myriangium duriaei CBS 260.36]